MLTQKGVLPIGCVVDGVVHKEFELRSATVQDNIDVTEELVADGKAPNALNVGSALMARQLVRLGTLSPEQITTALMRSLPVKDWNALDAASSELEKKMLRFGPLGTPDGGLPAEPPSSPEASTQT